MQWLLEAPPQIKSTMLQDLGDKRWWGEGEREGERGREKAGNRSE
jgi:hypothetical protein